MLGGDAPICVVGCRCFLLAVVFGLIVDFGETTHFAKAFTSSCVAPGDVNSIAGNVVSLQQASV